MDMLEGVRQALKNRNESLRQIAEAAGVKHDWLAKFAQGKFHDPGYRKIKRLHHYFSAKKDEAA